MPYLRLQRALDYLVWLDSAVTVAKVGLFLNTYKEHFLVKDEDLAFLRSRRPLHRCYMFPAEHGGKLVSDWNLIVPLAVLERAWEEPL